MKKLSKLALKNKHNSAILALVLAPFLLTSCTSLNKSRVYAGLGGAIAGAGVGVAVGEVVGERNGYQKHSNMLAGGAIGAATGAIFGVILANFFWNEDPENRKMNQMLEGKEGDKKTAQAIKDMSANSILDSSNKAIEGMFSGQSLEAKVYSVESEPLPDALKGKTLKQELIEYTIPEGVIHLDSGRTIYRDKSKAYEHSFHEDSTN